MTVEEKYRCNICGKEVIVTKAGGGTLVCCGENMEKISQQLLIVRVLLVTGLLLVALSIGPAAAVYQLSQRFDIGDFHDYRF